MTDLLTAIGLGALQGFTEFLPVSSSGHLALVLQLTGLDEEAILPFTVALHLATTLAVVLYLRREVLSVLRGLLPGNRGERTEGRRLLLLVVAGTIPTAIIGLAFKDVIESLFSSPRWVAAGLAVTAAILFLADRRLRNFPSPVAPAAFVPITPLRSALVGVAQGVAIAPGISRSGATIGAGLLLGIAPREAFTLSFLLSIPANLGALILEAGALGNLLENGILFLAAGAATAFITGYGALAILSRVLSGGRLWYFALYCLALSATVFVITLTQ